jgi:hypothetical protein
MVRHPRDGRQECQVDDGDNERNTRPVWFHVCWRFGEITAQQNGHQRELLEQRQRKDISQNEEEERGANVVDAT